VNTRKPRVALVPLNIILVRCLLVAPAWASPAPPAPDAPELLGQYRAMPHPGPNDPGGEARLARLEVLAQLSLAADVLPEMRRAWPSITDSRQRAELAEMVGRKIQTAEAATLLIEWLKDPAEEVRGEAVHGLRMMSRRTDRTGGRRTVVRAELVPKVEGLVPALISAANDPSERVRYGAMWALADARDHQATQELREHLDDPSAQLRLLAACFLTEFQDASGMPEIRRALERLKTSNPEDDFRHYADAEMVLASLERITRRSQGKIPLNPSLSSNLDDVETLKAQYDKLVRSWSEFLSSDEGARLLRDLGQARPK